MRNNDSSIKYLYAAERAALFRALDNDNSKYALRNRAIFRIAEYGGLRASEVGMILISDINIVRREIYFKRLKRSNNNTLRILDEDVFHALTQYLAARLEKDEICPFLFKSQKRKPISRKTLDSLMKHYCQMANISCDKAHFHVLKHTRAVYLADLGLDTKEIQYWLGHKSSQNTEIYLQFTSRQHETLYQKILHLTELEKKDRFFQS